MRTLALAPIVATVALCAAPAFADLELPAVFGDHMVLQRDSALPVWGRATAGAKVSVTFGEATRSTTADPNGAWTVTLPATSASASPRDLVITADGDRVTLHDVLVGDVWLCGGQSNMEWPIALSNSVDEAAKEAATGKRATIRAFKMPHTLAEQPLFTNDARWRVANGDSVKNMTAVGYEFSRALSDALDVPIGILDINWGGTRIEPWMRGGQMFNAMIEPVTPFAIRGAIWYQGESNAGEASKYAEQLTQLIGAWREEFKRDAMPFGVVQLAAFQEVSDDPAQGGWSDLRVAQAAVSRAVPKTGLAVTLDVGDAKDIHPRDKRTVGQRLANWALAAEFGRAIPASSPVAVAIEPATVDGAKALRVRFEHAEGLAARAASQPDGFGIAGADGRFVWAKARVDGQSILVWSPDVAEPVEVAYAWQNNPVRANVVNGAGLPAGPFRMTTRR
jgi:sialate O-acetylesterase